MSARALERRKFKIGAIDVIPARNVLVKKEEEAAVEPRVMDVLCALAETSEEVVSRETLLERFWNSDIGAEERLNRAAYELRKAFKALDPDEDYIETIKRRGYRLMKPVEIKEPALAALTGSTGAQFSSRALVASALIAISALVGLVWFAGQPSAFNAPEKSLAVMPFEARSDDPSDAYFGDGLAEELLNALSSVPELKVPGRSVSFALAEEDADAREIGRRLGVAHLLEGSVRRSGDRLRVTAQLVRTSDGSQLWSNTYDRRMTDIFTIQDSIVSEINRTLRIRLAVGDFAHRRSCEGVDPRACEQYLVALGHFGNRMRTDDGRMKAYNAFKAAAEYDPYFADAWAGVAFVGATSAGSALSRNRAAFTAEIENAFEKAMALDPDNGDTHAALAFWHLGTDFDIEKARIHVEKAKALTPIAPGTLYAEARYHAIAGDVAEAISVYDVLVEIQPDNASGRLLRAHFLANTGRVDDAFQFFNTCLATKCLQEAFIAFAMTEAVFSGEQRYIDQWWPVWQAFYAEFQKIPDSRKPLVASIMPGYYSIALELPDKEARAEEIRAIYARRPITENVGMWGPAFAGVLPEDVYFDALEASVKTGDFIASAHSLAPFYGANPYPDWVLRHPRYHALWARPELAKLAELRRENGFDDALPIEAIPHNPLPAETVTAAHGEDTTP